MSTRRLSPAEARAGAGRSRQGDTVKRADPLRAPVGPPACLTPGGRTPEPFDPYVNELSDSDLAARNEALRAQGSPRRWRRFGYVVISL